MDDLAILAVERRMGDLLGPYHRLTAFVDGSPVGKLRRGEAIELTLDPGVHAVRVRMSFMNSNDVTVRLPPGSRTVVSFAIEDWRRDATFGLRTLKSRSRGSWGVRVTPTAHYVSH